MLESLNSRVLLRLDASSLPPPPGPLPHPHSHPPRPLEPFPPPTVRLLAVLPSPGLQQQNAEEQEGQQSLGSHGWQRGERSVWPGRPWRAAWGDGREEGSWSWAPRCLSWPSRGRARSACLLTWPAPHQGPLLRPWGSHRAGPPLTANLPLL